MTALHMLKYAGTSDLGALFGELLAERWRTQCHGALTTTVVTAIPLHKRRERERGFNQAEIIAQAFAKALGVRYVRLISRPKPTRSQATLGYGDRQKNIVGAFAPRPQSEFLDKEMKLVFPFKTVILIDDVVTTGATLHEASRVLQKSGATTVHALTVAYAPKRTRGVDPGEVRRMVRQQFAKL